MAFGTIVFRTSDKTQKDKIITFWQGGEVGLWINSELKEDNRCELKLIGVSDHWAAWK